MEGFKPGSARYEAAALSSEPYDLIFIKTSLSGWDKAGLRVQTFWFKP